MRFECSQGTDVLESRRFATRDETDNEMLLEVPVNLVKSIKGD